MKSYHDDDACESFETEAFAGEWKNIINGDKPLRKPDDDKGSELAEGMFPIEPDEYDEPCFPLSGHMVLEGTPEKIGELIAKFLGPVTIRCTLDWSADWRGF